MTETYFDGENELEVVRDNNSIKYYLGNKSHRLDGPADIRYYENGNVETKEYWYNNKLHRSDGPAFIEYYENGNVKSEEYWVNDSLRSQNGPTVVCYYENGNINREEYYIYDNDKLHGSEEKTKSFLGRKPHRIDGPAFVWYDKNGDILIEEYWVNGIEIDTEQFDIDFNNLPLSLEDQLLIKMTV